jgi:signal transduction histidine kinase
MNLDRRELRVALDRAGQPMSFDIWQAERDKKASFRIANISRSGMFLETQEAVDLERGESLHFALRLDSEGSAEGVRGVARVRWVRPKDQGPYKPRGLGIQVIEFHDNSEKRYLELLEQFVLRLKIGDLMDARPAQAAAETPMGEVLRILDEHRSGCVVAVSGDGVPIGMLVQADLPRIAMRRAFREEPLGMHMTPGPTLISVDQTLEEAYALMRAGVAEYLPVVEEDVLVGVLSTRDLFRYWAEFMELQAKRLAGNCERAMSVIAHDLRTPIGLIQTTNQMLSAGHIDAAEYVSSGFPDVVTQSCEMMLNLIDDILDLGKIKAGAVRLNCVSVELDELVKHTAVAFSTTAMIKRITIEVKSGGPLPRIKADPARLEQVLNNLVSNAVKFTPDGGHIVIGTRLMHSKVSFWVADNGPGIGEAELGRLFEEYTPLSTHGTRGEKGTGLGLAITRKLVEAHGGTIAVESRTGLGTTFTVTLPIGDLQ